MILSRQFFSYSLWSWPAASRRLLPSIYMQRKKVTKFQIYKFPVPQFPSHFRSENFTFLAAAGVLLSLPSFQGQEKTFGTHNSIKWAISWFYFLFIKSKLKAFKCPGSTREALLSTFHKSTVHSFATYSERCSSTACHCAAETQWFTQRREWKTGYVIRLTDSVKITQKERQIPIQDKTYFIVL